ncbi:uncharacterized protein G2W53_027317 [Senna tora]|uniref:Uncharacterized protein n=1 Tax=Senna tora TaxID=362788 RepID=A0A834TGN5_9FABA|nr:uncharacterized protein G2W53_027317 [Senna tora]
MKVKPETTSMKSVKVKIMEVQVLGTAFNLWYLLMIASTSTSADPLSSSADPLSSSAEAIAILYLPNHYPPRTLISDSSAADLDHQIVSAYDLYGIPDVQPHAYMAGVMIGHDACGIVAKNKKVFAIDFLFVADAFLVVMAAWRASTVKRRMYLVHSREKLPSRSPPLRLQHGVQVGLEHALEGLEHAMVSFTPIHSMLDTGRRKIVGNPRPPHGHLHKDKKEAAWWQDRLLVRDVGLFGVELPGLRLRSGCGMVESHQIVDSRAAGMALHWVAG